MKVVIFLLLLCVALSDNTVALYCGSCGSLVIAQYCVWMDLSGTTSTKYPLRFGMTCTSITGRNVFPAFYTFTCDQKCSQGCFLTTTVKDARNYKQCSTGKASSQLISTLNILYSLMVGDITLGSTKDWCNCRKKQGKGESQHEEIKTHGDFYDPREDIKQL